MSYVWHLPPKNLLLMREADAWATPRAVRTEMEVMPWEGQGGTGLFWFRGQRETVHWESWDLGGEENRRDEWRTIQAELWGQRPETQYQAWLTWEVSEDLRSWSMEVGAGPQEAAHWASFLSYFIPDSHTRLHSTLAFLWLLQYSLTVEKAFRKHCMLNLS